MITRGTTRRNMQEEMWEAGDTREEVSEMEELRCVPQKNSENVGNRLVYDTLRQMAD